MASPSLPPDLPAQKLDWQLYERRPAGQVCQGYYVSPPLDLPEADRSLGDARLFAEGRQLDYSPEGGMNLQGEVRLRQGPLYLLSDQAQLNADRTRARFTGNLEVRQDNFLLRAEEGDYELDSNYLRAEGAHYLIHDQHMRGAAWKLEQLPDGRVRLQEASMTTCSPDDHAWRLVAKRIDLNRESGFGDAYHVRMEVQKVPVFYVPWVRFPIDDRRHTGLLSPTISYSTSQQRLDYIQPFYWSLAPNYDATFWPRYIGDRGWMLGTEFRYLQPSDAGQLFYARLNNDDRYYGLDRWHFAAQHTGRWEAAGLNYNLDFAQASDHSYFYDLAKGRFGDEDNERLLQQLRLDYRWNNWQGRLQARGYQELRRRFDPNSNAVEPETTFALFDLRQGRDARRQDYYQLPQLEIRGRERLSRHFQAGFLMDLTYFDKLADEEASTGRYFTQNVAETGGDFYISSLNNWGAPRATRLHLEPSLSGDWTWPWAYVRPQVKLKHSSYWLDPYWDENVSQEERDGVNLEPSVTVPVYSLDTGIFLERDARFFGQDMIQTLEPRVFSAYVPFVEQYDVPNLFDGSFSEFDINQLYRAERTGGRDRVGDVQKTTLGVTQRLLNQDTGREVVSFAVAQEFYWADRRVNESYRHPDDPNREDQLPRAEQDYSQVRERSNLAFQANWNITRNLQLRSSLLWDERLEKTDRANTRFSYQDGRGMHLNLGHTYTSNYQNLGLQGPRPSTDELDAYSYTAEAEEQLYISGVFPLHNEHWRFFFKRSWDWKRDEVLDSLTGLEYTSCCWQLQMVYRDWIKDPDFFPKGETEERDRDQAIYLQVVFRGLGGAGQSTRDLLGTEIQGFTERSYSSGR
ncbi:LPS-assembly protein [Marinospirillum celere]|uniref:LPS-assembly protein LptD n=1 Tax=Marinospirillum celere TaxID=1122252 RepID=A0A1I1GTJ6_9GAMM|nr:LPS assembly protein LptD [Marinospirillum celere]SFC14816.1 LPS-assembly protein [Marinospirillum celere]